MEKTIAETIIERLNILYQNTDEANKLIRKSFLELIEVCNLIKLLSIRNAEKVKSLLDILTTDNENISLLEIGDETYTIIVKLLKNGKSAEDISKFLEIDIDLIKAIKI